MNWRKSILPLSTALLLASCGDGGDASSPANATGPSAADVQIAVAAHMKADIARLMLLDDPSFDPSQLDGFKFIISDHKCRKAAKGRYHCTFTYRIDDQETGESESKPASSLLEQRADKWIVIKE